MVGFEKVKVMAQNSYQRKFTTHQGTAAVTSLFSGARRMPVASNAGTNNLGASHNPTGVPTVAVQSRNALRSQQK
jgi:hypothetical protein